MITEASNDPVKRSFGWMTRIKPLILENGKIILPLYSDGFNMSLMAISEDHGQSWRPSSPLVGRGPIQLAIVKKKNGDLIAFLRDSGDEPSMVQKSESHDQGETWTAATKTEIPNTASVELLVLKDGRWAFIGNDQTDGRYRLSLYISNNEGQTWNSKYLLENDITQKKSYSYPSLIQSPDGNLHISYSFHEEKIKKSIKYIVLNPNKI